MSCAGVRFRCVILWLGLCLATSVFGAPPRLLISEFLADNNTSIRDGYGESSDWIELYNADSISIDLAGWTLADSTNLVSRWSLPKRTLAPGSFLLVFASGRNAIDPHGHPHSSFKLSAEGGYLGLIAPDGTPTSQFNPYPPQKEDISYGLSLGLSWTRLMGPGDRARYFIPKQGDDTRLGTTWTGGAPFPDLDWTLAELPFGFDSSPLQIPIEEPITLRNPSATFAQPNFGIEETVDGIITGDNGWAVFGGQEQPQTAVYQTSRGTPAGRLTLSLHHGTGIANHMIKEFRLSYTLEEEATVNSTTSWVPFALSSSISSAGSHFFLKEDLRYRVVGPQTGVDIYTLVSESLPAGVRGFRLELFPSDSNGDGTATLGRDRNAGENGNFVLSEVILGSILRGPERFQLTFGQPVEPSGPLYAGYPAANLTDGNPETFSHNNIPEEGFFFRIPLDARFPLDEIEVVSRRDCCNERLINYQVSLFELLKDEPGRLLWSAGVRTDLSLPEMGGTDHVYPGLDPLGNFRGALLQIQNRDMIAPRYLQIAEVRAVTTNWARHSEVVSNFTPDESHPLSYAVDGEKSTWSSPASTDVSSLPNRYEVRLPATISLSALQLSFPKPPKGKTYSRSYRVSVHERSATLLSAPLWSADFIQDRRELDESVMILPEADASGIFTGNTLVIESLDQDFPILPVAEVRAFGKAGQSGYFSFYRTDLQAAMRGINSSAWIRVPFTGSPGSTFDALKLRVRLDDGMAVWLNGREAARVNAPSGALPWNARASQGAPNAMVHEMGLPLSSLQSSGNTLAFQLLNHSPESEDLLLAPEVWGRNQILGNSPGYFVAATPGALNQTNYLSEVAAPVVDRRRGLYDAPIEILITGPTPGSTLIYSTNGTAPSLTNGVSVAPSSASASPSVRISAAANTTLRAVAWKTSHLPSRIITHSYLFPKETIKQPALPSGWPLVWGTTRGDYEMDPEIAQSVTYKTDLEKGLRNIPSISVVMDMNDFLGPQEGIYTFPENRGPEWEKAISFEWIDPVRLEDTQENAGIEVWGNGWRPHAASLKHSFKISFKKKYGKGSINFPIFREAPIKSFDEFVLRAQGSRSWNDTRFPDITQAQYLRDAFARDTAVAMGKVEGHATFAHLYINGLYWGLYNPVERPAEGFAADYFGGAKEDYDIINRRAITEAISGDLIAWNRAQALADIGPEDATIYQAMSDLVDLDNLIDYLLYNQYATNHDGPDSNSNNMRALRRRRDGEKFLSFFWDMEYTLWYPRENRNIAMDVPNTLSHLYARLRRNPDFRLRFADRIQKHLFGSGALTPTEASSRYSRRVEEIRHAIVGESARWGDVRREPPYTRDGEWTSEANRLFKDYFPNRTEILLQQLKEAGLYPNVTPPELGASVQGNTLEASDGNIYYTLDGADPRDPSGTVSPSASMHPGRKTLVEFASPSRYRVVTVHSDRTWTQPGFDDSDFESALASNLGYNTVNGSEAAVPLRQATADYSQPDYSVAAAIDGNTTTGGWGFIHNTYQSSARPAVAVFEAVSPVAFAEGAILTFTLHQNSFAKHSLGRFRLSVTSDAPSEFADGQVTNGDIIANWVICHPLEVRTANATELIVYENGSILAAGNIPDSETYTIKAIVPSTNITGFRIETFEDPSLASRGPGRSANGNAVLTEFQVHAAPAPRNHLVHPVTSELLRSQLSEGGKELQMRIPFVLDYTGTEEFVLIVNEAQPFEAFLNGTRIELSGGLASHQPLVETHYRFFGTALQGTNWLALRTLPSNQPGAGGLVIAPRLYLSNRLTVPTAGRTQVRARTRVGDQWSALVESTSALNDLHNGLRITEVMYHPPTNPVQVPYDKEQHEFIEVQNLTTRLLRLDGVRLTEGIEFEFPSGFVLEPGECTVAVRNPAAFRTRHPDSRIRVAGKYNAALNNAGERIELRSADGLIQQFTYNPNWVVSSDGGGDSLTIRDATQPLSEWDSPTGWIRSSVVHGTPGRTDAGVFLPNDRDNDGLHDSWEIRHFANLSATGLEDTDGDGSTNREEYLAGTNPRDKSDRLFITLTHPLNQLRIQFQTSFDTYDGHRRFYRIEWSAPESIQWLTLSGQEQIPAQGGRVERVITPPVSGPIIFRVVATLD